MLIHSKVCPPPSEWWVMFLMFMLRTLFESQLQQVWAVLHSTIVHKTRRVNEEFIWQRRKIASVQLYPAG